MQITLTERQLINYFVDGQEDASMDVFMEDGPKGLRGYLSIPSDRDDVWKAIYDYFIFEKNLLITVCERFEDFLVDVMTAYGPEHIRKMFQIEDSKYDEVFHQIVQMIGVARSGLFKFVRRNPENFLSILHQQGSHAVRQKLHIVGFEYDNVWKKILDILLETCAGEKIHERQRDHVMAFFCAFRKSFFRSS